MASTITPKFTCSGVCLYRLLRTTSASSPRFSSITMRRPSRSDSSRRSETPSIVFGRLLHRGLGADGDAAAAGDVRLHDAGAPDDPAAGREIRARDDPQQ